MRNQSLKAKGRRWQQEVEYNLKEIFLHLDGNDVLSRPMGSQGSDLILSPKALEVLPYDFEMKNQERSKIWADLRQSEDRLETQLMYPILMLKRNHLKNPLKKGIAVIPFAHYCSLLTHHRGLTEIDHMMSARCVFDILGKSTPVCCVAALREAASDLYEIMTSRECRVDWKFLHLDNHEPIRFHHAKALNIWTEFTGQPLLFDRNDSDHTMYIAVRAEVFYGLLSELNAYL